MKIPDLEILELPSRSLVSAGDGWQIPSALLNHSICYQLKYQLLWFGKSIDIAIRLE